MTSERCEICERLEIWPVRLIVGGISGWSLWCSGETDVLLARGGRVQLFPSAEALVAAVLAEPDAYTPAAVRLDGETLREIVADPPAVLDLDSTPAWFAKQDREATMAACEAALNALNMATDICATAGDGRFVDILSSDGLSKSHDALTFGQTLLGDGRPYRNNPAAMTSVITPEAATAARELITLAASHVEDRSNDIPAH
jgi:hypothetical protein